jgi:PIN domain nuclease of toxin-antitoxin system
VAARAVFDGAVSGAHQVLIPAIVFAESILLIEKQRIQLDTNLMVDSLRRTQGFFFTALTPDIVANIQSLTSFSDIHDRLIVSEAFQVGAVLITQDEDITRSNLVEVVW